MLAMKFKQVLAIYLAVLMVQPFPMNAASTAAVLGSISSYGPVKVGDIAAPAQNTLFAGDLVKTESGNAVIQYKDGARVLLAKESSAQFSPNSIELKNGGMAFHAVSESGPIFNASSLKLEPAAPSSSANVSVNDGKASVSVTEGAIRAVDPVGGTLTVIRAGQTQLFAMASPAAAAPAAPAPASASAAAPPLMGGSSMWLLVVGGAAAAITTTLAITLNNNAADEAAEIRALSNELTSLLAIPPAQRTAAQNARIAELQQLLASKGVPVSPFAP